MIILACVLIIIASIVVIAAIIYKNVDEERGKEMEAISISSYPERRVFYVGEEYDPTGIEVQVIAKNGSSTYIKDPTQLTFSGFDSSAPAENQVVTITYKGVSTSIEVEIIPAPTLAPTLTAIEVYNMQTVYTLDFWSTYGPETGMGRLKCYYSDGSVVEDVPLRDRHIYDIDWTISAPGKTYVTVRYSDGVTTVETQVEITITE